MSADAAVTEGARSEAAFERATTRTRQVAHIDEETALAFSEKTLPADQERNVRRHILFCKTCGSKVIQLTRKREVARQQNDEAESKVAELAQVPELAPEQVQAIEARLWSSSKQRRMLRVTTMATAFAIVLAFVIIVWTPHDGDEIRALAAPAPAFVELYTLGPDSRRVEGTLRTGEELALRITAPELEAAYVYVFFLGPRGELRALAPDHAESGQAQPFVASQVVLPASARQARPRGFGLDFPVLETADEKACAAVIVLTSPRSLVELEGRLRDLVTLPALASDLIESKQDSVDEATARLLAARMEARFLPELLEVFPLRLES